MSRQATTWWPTPFVNGDFCLIELELNEPGLYFNYAPEQAVHFASVIDDLTA